MKKSQVLYFRKKLNLLYGDCNLLSVDIPLFCVGESVADCKLDAESFVLDFLCVAGGDLGYGIVAAALFQLKETIADKGERVAIPESRKQIALYLKSFRGAAQIRAKINRATSYEEVEAALKSALD